MSVLVLGLWGTSATAALHVITMSGVTQGATVSSQPYTQDVLLPDVTALQQALRQSHAAIERVHTISLPALLSHSNASTRPDEQAELTPGVVVKHHIPGVATSIPLFVMGTDKYSLDWLRTNAEYLRRIHALGVFRTPVSNAKRQRIEQATGLTFVTIRLQGIASLMGIEHTPFLFYHGWVVQ